MHSEDGMAHACCICFEWFSVEQLEPVAGEPGKVWDVCQGCAQHERDVEQRSASAT